ncbi:MAG: multicopper oxidase domain-containing protein [Thermodesulfobacteriota bacterium]
MNAKTSRRGFLAALGAAVLAPLAARAQDHGHGHGHAAPAAPAAPGGVPAAVHPDMGPVHVWRDPARPISPPPPTMGKQMGRVRALNLPPLGYELDGKVKVFRLIAQPVLHTLTAGGPLWPQVPPRNRYAYHHHGYPQRARLWGYNGRVPGPTIECRQGDTIRVVLVNELPEPTSIHWHGLEVPNAMDGAGGISEPATPPGATRVYEFSLRQTGAFLYHTGFNDMKQEGMGLGGMLVIHPAQESSPPEVDLTVLLQQFALVPGSESPNLVTMDFNWFAMNGKSAPDIEVIKARQGQRVRLRIGNLSMDSHPIHLHGHTWRVVGTEAGPIPASAQWPGNTVDVPPGSVREVEFIADNPGVWHLHCHKMHHTMNAHAEVPLGVMAPGGMTTLMVVEPGHHGGGHHG